MADKHISELRKEEASMIGEIKQGTDSCIKQIKSLLNNEKLKHLQATLTSNINKINSELSSLKQKRTKFKELSIPQKLQVTKLPSSIETEEPPSIEAATKLAKKLRVEVSYRDAIMKRKFPIL
jgi:predicted  nucleic acid-binding Zn-ribbon protein